MRRLGVVTAAVAAILGVGQVAAVADDTVTVHGTEFPDLRSAQLTLVGCESLYDRSTEFLQPYVSRGPGRPALGTRSLKYDLAGGNAIGTLSYVESMADTSVAGLQVYSRPGAQGVAYAGFQSPDAEGHDLWVGRAPLTAVGSWQRVDATSLSYTWTELDMRTGRPTGATAPAAPVADFAAAHGGDGAGFYMVGFGCDGAPFYLDGWRIGAPGTTTTYDLEGLTTRLTMGGSTHSVEPGEEVTLRGSVRDGAGKRLVRGTMVLEAKPAGGAGFLPVRVVDAASSDPAVTVTPTESTVYRWRFADRPLATGSVSEEFRVDVRQPEPDPAPSPDPGPTPPAPGPSSPEPTTPEPSTPGPPPTATPDEPTPTPPPPAVPPGPETTPGTTLEPTPAP